VQSFGPKDALAKVEKVLALPEAERPVVLIFLVTCDVPANARQQVRERHPDGCYHRALHLLGGYPIWRSEDIADADLFVKFALPKDLRARVAGSEVDAAINDPQWKAREALRAMQGPGDIAADGD
jgi:hypothetical protein